MRVLGQVGFHATHHALDFCIIGRIKTYLAQESELILQNYFTWMPRIFPMSSLLIPITLASWRMLVLRVRQR